MPALVVLTNARIHVDVEAVGKWVPDHLRSRASGMTSLVCPEVFYIRGCVKPLEIVLPLTQRTEDLYRVLQRPAGVTAR